MEKRKSTKIGDKIPLKSHCQGRGLELELSGLWSCWFGSMSWELGDRFLMCDKRIKIPMTGAFEIPGLTFTAHIGSSQL